MSRPLLVKKSLYRVGDEDRPLYVLADNFGDAVDIWEEVVRAENPGWEGPAQPESVELISDLVSQELFARYEDEPPFFSADWILLAEAVRCANASE